MIKSVQKSPNFLKILWKISEFMTIFVIRAGFVPDFYFGTARQGLERAVPC